MISRDQIEAIIKRHYPLLATMSDSPLYNSFLDDLDDLFLEAFREGQKDPDWDR